jgi:oligopeptidase B
MIGAMQICRLLLPALFALSVAGAGRAQDSAAAGMSASAAAALTLTAPRAERRPFKVASPHGQREDDYHWLRDDDPKAKRPEVLRLLEAENRYTEAVLAPLKGLRERLYKEMSARVKADDSTVPVYDNGWWIWQQFEAGVDHPKLMRRRGTPEAMLPGARAEVLLDLPQQAIAQRFYSLGMASLSPDGQWLAWTEDVVGSGSHDLYIQNLQTRRLAPERIRGVLEGFAWASDSRTLFYVRHDPVTLHSGAVWRHARGQDVQSDQLVHEEADKTLFVQVRPSASRRWVLIDIQGSDTSELRGVPADRPGQAASVLFARRPGVRLQADHIGKRWVLRTNDGAPNFRLMDLADSELDRPQAWRTLMPASDTTTLEAFEAFNRALAVEERVQAHRRVRVLDPDGKTLRLIDGGTATSVSLGDKLDAAAAYVQVVTQSMVRPPATLDVHLDSGREIVRRQDTVRGHDPARYRTELIWATARDGVKVPVTLAWRPDRATRDGSAPLLIEAYGAYGTSYEPDFAAHRLSLMSRGFVIALAHVRGGGELGQSWYEAGRLMNKHHSFDDFVDVTDYLVTERWGAADKVFAQGSSAGGLLMAVVANEAGSRYRGLALDVPFVDVVTTMLDASIPLTANEWGQWGDPRQKLPYDYLLSYSPYDNITARDYPAMLVTGALWDTQVQFHEPVKYVARLRATKTDRNPLLLDVDLNAGHGGSSGRFERPRHWARQYAFFLDLAGLADSPASSNGLPPEIGDPDLSMRSIRLTR